MKTSELTGAALDWAVAKCELQNGANYTLDVNIDIDGTLRVNFGGMYPEWSTDWKEGGEIIEREGMSIVGVSDSVWDAHMSNVNFFESGTTPLIAAMRCYVASNLGDDVEVPEELQGETA
jgi:hypothetical protein